MESRRVFYDMFSKEANSVDRKFDLIGMSKVVVMVYIEKLLDFCGQMSRS